MIQTVRMTGTRESMLFRLLIALGVLVLLPSMSACGQIQQVQLPISPTGANRSYWIHVAFNNTTKQCVYRIPDYDEPDRILIKPHGLLGFHSSADSVFIEVARDVNPGRHYGIGGLRKGQDTAFMLNSGEEEARIVRDSLPGPVHSPTWNHTEHKIWIVCVADGEEIPAIDWITATEGSGGMNEGNSGRGSAQDMGEGGPSLQKQPERAEARSEDDPPRRATGGPTMEIDDP